METSNKSIRKDWQLIQTLVDANKKVLDIGCGEGELLRELIKNKNSDTRGLEIDGNFVRNALAYGLSVVQGNAETDLNQYTKNSFDYVILSQTLQAMHRPKDVLLEMLNIGDKVIVSFPNFGYWKIRIKLLVSGKMPITKGLPYSWYETPNIHFFTLKDFQEMCKELKIFIEKSIGITASGRQFEIRNDFQFSNLITQEAIFLLTRKKFEPIKIKSKKFLTTPSRIATA